MARRSISPMRTITRSEGDPRENIIRKLKEDLIVARGREKEKAIIQNYLLDAQQKTRILEAEKIKSDEQGRIKLDMTQKTLLELKKEREICLGQQRNLSIEIRQIQQELADLNKLHDAKTIEIQKLKRQGVALHAENEKLVNEHYKLRALEDETNHEIRKVAEAVRQYEGQGSEVNRKLVEVKAYINSIDGENHELKEKLKSFEEKNNGISGDIDQKDQKIDNLQRTFEQRHQVIKNQVDNYIELEHKKEKYIKQNQHKLNLIRLQNDKANDLAAAQRKLEKVIAGCSQQLEETKAQSQQLNRINKDFIDKNGQMKKDLIACQQHLENLLQHNAFIQEQMENYLREDEAIINIIRRKRIIPTANHYASIRSSRADVKASARTYL